MKTSSSFFFFHKFLSDQTRSHLKKKKAPFFFCEIHFINLEHL